MWGTVDMLVLFAPELIREVRTRLLLDVAPPDQGAAGPWGWICDPADFSVHGSEMLMGRQAVWLTGEAKATTGTVVPCSLALELSLTAGDSIWTGSGYAAGTGGLAFGTEATGSADALVKHTGALAASLLSGATTLAASMTTLTMGHSAARFDVTAPLGKPDQDGRRKLVIGRPGDGLLDRLPSDCRLDEAERTTPVLLDGAWHQSVTMRLRLPEGAIATRPIDRTVENAAGSFEVTASEADGWLTCVRRLTLGVGAGTAANWPALRALLLEEADAANGTLTWRPGAKAPPAGDLATGQRLPER